MSTTWTEMLTEEERDRWLSWAGPAKPEIDILLESLAASRLKVVSLQAALRDSMDYTAQLTEERDDARSRLRLEQASFRACDRFLVAATLERDRQREDIQRLLRVAQDCMAEAVAFTLALKPEGIVWDWEPTEHTLKQAAEALIELKERYDA